MLRDPHGAPMWSNVFIIIFLITRLRVEHTRITHSHLLASPTQTPALVLIVNGIVCQFIISLIALSSCLFDPP